MPSPATHLQDPRQPAVPAREGFWRQLREAFTGTALALRQGWWWKLAAFALVAAFAWFVVRPHDDAWMLALRDGGNPSSWKKNLAGWIGATGDDLGFNLGVGAVFWLAGAIFKRPRWQRIALASVAAMVFAGFFCNLLRPTLGRPRPSTREKWHVADTLQIGRGWTGGHAYQSFPSAHTATAFGTATAVAVACPPAGLPLLAFASSMAWARMVQNSHHPSDVLAGAAIGILTGIAAGRRARNPREIQRLDPSDAATRGPDDRPRPQ